MKSYTNIKQSEKLAEILPHESADMCHIKTCVLADLDWRFDDKALPLLLGDTPLSEVSRSTLPCWSLAALLKVIPKRINDYNVLRIDISVNDFAIWYDEIGYGVNNDLPNITTESAVDACYEMILKLHELKML